jgi:diacylglycerol O-acyltransferase / wax synthase
VTMARLGGFDAGLLFLEFSQQSMNVAVLIELDTSTVPGGFTFAGFREQLSRRLAVLPEFRVKLASSAFNLDNPVWVDDLEFDIDRHLHRIGLPGPGGRRDLADLAAQFIAAPLERSRPLWQMWVIECGADGAADPRVALLLKQHHAMMDGKTESGLMARMCTTEVDAPDPERIDGAGTVSARDITIDGAVRFFARPVHLVTKLLPGIARAVAVLTRRARRTRVLSNPFKAPATTFNGNATADRNIAFVQLDLADIKAVKNDFGVKLNDVVLALLSGALRDYLRDRNELPESPLMAAVPMAIADRTDDGGGNQMSLASCSLYTQIPDAADRLRAIAAASSVAKERSTELGLNLLRDISQYVSPRLYGALVRLYVWSGMSRRMPMFNLSVTNVPAAPTQWYLGNARVLAMYGLPPVMHGFGLHAGVSSLNGKLEIGFTSCPQLVPDLWELADRVAPALKELLATGHPSR